MSKHTKFNQDWNSNFLGFPLSVISIPQDVSFVERHLVLKTVEYVKLNNTQQQKSM